ncbi:MAG: phage tail sheath subtilisin-like domain-containing protein, partial [Planctomycetes bacterium]|nr:phage tail sheath subtilisin-like domain-containing protein [Planctomycetota bacterium]
DAFNAIRINGVTVPLSVQTTAAADRWFQSAAGFSPGTGENDGVREKLKIVAKAITDDPQLAYRAELWGYTLAIVATSGTMNEQPSAVATSPTAQSGFITNTRRYSLGTGGASDFSNSGVDGSDGQAPDEVAYLGSEAQETGFHALDAKDLFNLMVLPSDEEVSEATMMNLWGPAAAYCKRRRAFLVIDSPPSWTDANGRPQVAQDTTLINDLRGRLGDARDHAAVFYPRLRYSDRGVARTIGAAAAIAGLMARIDATRGVWKAPAGVEAGIRSIIGVNVELTDAYNGVLNKKGVNCIRVFPSGIVNWGARTLDGDDDFGSEWKYVPIRRLALMIEESLFRGTKWVVFEPNDEPLWSKIRLNVGAFLDSLFRQGAFQGTSPQEAYFVKCDKETTTQDDRNKGIVNILVGFAPLKPAEFVVITIQQMAGEL